METKIVVPPGEWKAESTARGITIVGGFSGKSLIASVQTVEADNGDTIESDSSAAIIAMSPQLYEFVKVAADGGDEHAQEIVAAIESIFASIYEPPEPVEDFTAQDRADEAYVSRGYNYIPTPRTA